MLEKESLLPEFWDDAAKARAKMKQLADLTSEIDDWARIENEVKSLGELTVLAIEENDEPVINTILKEIKDLSEEIDAKEFKMALSGQHDKNNAILAIHAGAGGTESQDWVRMLIRMFLRWAERNGLKGDVLDMSPGEEAGVKSAVLQVSGDFSYGYLRSERGVHRMVRISPFDADHARHTSFALVEVLPEVEMGVDVSIDPADLKIEVFKAGGAGGQSVQKNSTAVRITHQPTGIRVSCQNERSQYQNKTIAMRILTARLAEREADIKSKEVAKLKGDHIAAEWGNQIRSYVLHPYKMVKDHRTDYETSDAARVLDGDIQGFINEFLTQSIGENTTSKV